ncbi:hypothetical protein D3C81_1370520 [compost metagenome]
MSTMHTTTSTVHISDWRRAVLVSPAEMKVANSEIATRISAGTNQKLPRISMVSLRVRRVRRRDSGWLRIRWAIGRRKRRMNSPVHSAAITLARVARAWARWVPRATIRRGSLIASPNAAKLPISHSGRNAWWRRMCRARWRWGPSSSEKAITQMAEKQVPTTSA